MIERFTGIKQPNSTRIRGQCDESGFVEMIPRGVELVLVSSYGKQAGWADGSDRGTELQHRRHARRCCEKVKKERRANNCEPFGETLASEKVQAFLLW